MMEESEKVNLTTFRKKIKDQAKIRSQSVFSVRRRDT